MQSGIILRRFLACFVCLCVLVVNVSALASGIPGEWGMLSSKAVTEADVICAGCIVSTQAAPSLEPFWTDVVNGPTIEGYEAIFLVDSVVKGPLDLAKTRIPVQYPASQAHVPNALPDFAMTCDKRRVVVCLSGLGKKDRGVFRLLYGGGCFMLAGKRPEIKEWEQLSPDQRLLAEVVASLESSEIAANMAGMNSAANLKITDASVLKALYQLKADASAKRATEATVTLIELNDERTIYNLPDELSIPGDSELSENDRVRISWALWTITDAADGPAMVRLAMSEDPTIRRNAVHALRDMCSANCAAALVAALQDPEETARYDAIIGLYGIRKTEDKTGWYKPGEGWAPSLDLFRQDPEKSIRKWEQWWQEKGRVQYPSVETVLKEYEQTKENLEKDQKPVAPLASPNVPAFVSNPQPPTKAAKGWFERNGLLLLVGGVCVTAGILLGRMWRMWDRWGC